MAARDALGSRTSLAVSRGITRCVGSFYYAENKLQILVLFTSLVYRMLGMSCMRNTKLEVGLYSKGQHMGEGYAYSY